MSVDERGQMILPKELREKAGIHAGDKLAITSWEKEGVICCISLTKADDLINMVKATRYYIIYSEIRPPVSAGCQYGKLEY